MPWLVSAAPVAPDLAAGGPLQHAPVPSTRPSLLSGTTRGSRLTLYFPGEPWVGRVCREPAPLAGRGVWEPGLGSGGLGAPSPTAPAQRKQRQCCRLRVGKSKLSNPTSGFVCARCLLSSEPCVQDALGWFFPSQQCLPTGFGRMLSSSVFLCAPCWSSLPHLDSILFYFLSV